MDSDENPSEMDALPPEKRREALAEKNRVKPVPTKEQVDLAVRVLESFRDCSKLPTTLMSAVSTTLQDALKR